MMKRFTVTPRVVLMFLLTLSPQLSQPSPPDLSGWGSSILPTDPGRWFAPNGSAPSGSQVASNESRRGRPKDDSAGTWGSSLPDIEPAIPDGWTVLSKWAPVGGNPSTPSKAVTPSAAKARLDMIDAARGDWEKAAASQSKADEHHVEEASAEGTYRRHAFIYTCTTDIRPSPNLVLVLIFALIPTPGTWQYANSFSSSNWSATTSTAKVVRRRLWQRSVG